MAKLKKAPGRFIGRWKQEALADHPGASDEDLARIINDTARAQGFDYTITPDKVRTKSKKKRRKSRRTPASATASAAEPTPLSGVSLEDVRAVKGLVDRIGADRLQQLAGVLSE